MTLYAKWTSNNDPTPDTDPSPEPPQGVDADSSNTSESGTYSNSFAAGDDFNNLLAAIIAALATASLACVVVFIRRKRS